ncbi:MAG: DUF2157 domain-containing protein [Acidimicrobiia bacterium]|nr:DUF2157 domain-containing protein [Acidimicrobiia bacterium]
MRLVAPSVSPRPRRVAAVAEGLAYVGGMLGVLGLVLFAIRSWDDFSLFTRLALSGLSAAVLAFGGLVISDERQSASIRLRQFLWLGSTACVGQRTLGLRSRRFGCLDRRRHLFVGRVDHRERRQLDHRHARRHRNGRGCDLRVARVDRPGSTRRGGVGCVAHLLGDDVHRPARSGIASGLHHRRHRRHGAEHPTCSGALRRPSRREHRPRHQHHRRVARVGGVF